VLWTGLPCTRSVNALNRSERVPDWRIVWKKDFSEDLAWLEEAVARSSEARVASVERWLGVKSGKGCDGTTSGGSVVYH
jgi:tryptophan 2,3-dioxygenase